jgi:6-phosphofructokinase 1
VIRAVAIRAWKKSTDVVGIKDGWAGLLGEPQMVHLTPEAISDILPRGGTILGTSRTNPMKRERGIDEVIENLKGIDALVVIGGDDTLSVAYELYKRGGKVVGVPKTIDNDLPGTDYTFGFDTAVQVVTDYLDRLHTTAESHHRAIVVEVMGRHTGWIALHSGIAGGADYIVIPEVPFKIEDLCSAVERRRETRGFSILVAAEGAKPQGKLVTRGEEVDEFGHEILGGVAALLAKEIQERTGVETRSAVLGHAQRGGTPTAYDRALATRFGVKAMELIEDEKWGKMTSLQGGEIGAVDLKDVVGRGRFVDPQLYELAKNFFS